MKAILRMIPGMADKVSDEKIEEAENKFRIYTYLINSMTNFEKKPTSFKTQVESKEFCKVP
ncbi:hypothetical protein [Metamycoplasma hominis]|uniref:hypothetical protein n=1 Tax=Metamycoplasma hominis TaxID=2098 RepID=UPI001E2B4504|nr:hypothetical protein [Metamycoplasma hominis]